MSLNPSAFDVRHDELLHQAYGAALEPERWPDVLSAAAALWQAPRALLYSFSVPSGAVGFTFAHNISPRELQIYAARSASTDPFVEAAQRMGVLTEGRAHLGHELVTRSTLEATPFYRDIWRPLGIGQLCTGVIFDGTDAHKAPTALSFYRGPDDPPFTEEDRARLQRLLGHLSRALGVMFHLRDRESRVASTLSALDALRSGVLLLGADRSVQHLNAAARGILSMEDTVCLQPLHVLPTPCRRLSLVPRLSHIQRRFEVWLRRAATLGSDHAPSHFSEAFVLPGPAGQPQLVLNAAPLAPESPWPPHASAARVIVFMYDMTRTDLPPERLCELFSLTPAEAKAALQVLAGGSTTDMAARLGVSANTFKTQLAGAYAKTMTHRQADLLKLLLSLSTP